MFASLTKNLWPLLIGGVSLSLAGSSYFLNKNKHLFETKVKSWEYSPDISVEYIFKSGNQSSSDPICERWIKGNENKYESKRLEDDDCKRVVNLNLWGQNLEKEKYAEWLRVDSEYVDDIVWQYYLTKNENKEKIHENSWNVRNLKCTKTTRNAKGKVVIKCEKQEVANK